MGFCSVIGYQAFWQLFERANLDPFWACQLLDACIVPSNPAASLDAILIDPPKGVAGAEFQFTLLFTVINDTGVGQLAYVVYFPTLTQKFVNTTFFEDYAVGPHEVVLSFQTYNNASFIPGNYPIIFSLCAGMCGGRSPNSQILAEGQSYFVIGSKQAIVVV